MTQTQTETTQNTYPDVYAEKQLILESKIDRILDHLALYAEEDRDIKQTILELVRRNQKTLDEVHTDVVWAKELVADMHDNPRFDDVDDRNHSYDTEGDE